MKIASSEHTSFFVKHARIHVVEVVLDRSSVCVKRRREHVHVCSCVVAYGWLMKLVFFCKAGECP